MAGRDEVPPYAPLQMPCSHCQAQPGQRCRSTVIHGRPVLARPHAERVTAAREAEANRRMPKLPASVSDAWTCPACHRSYWPPREWEAELWPVLLRLLQQMHAARHRREDREAAGHPEDDR